MKWFYHPGYDYGGGVPGAPRELHGFLLCKPSAIRKAIEGAGLLRASDLLEPEAVSEAELLAVHAAALVEALRDPEAVAEAIESPELSLLPAEMVRQAVVLPQLLAAGGTCAALRVAAAGEWAVNLSGGFHHARWNRMHGFCLINDVALGLARLRREGVSRRTLIVDLDLHQGDGNATMFAEDADVYTVSVHEEAVFPIPKARSRLDVGLPSWLGDDQYLAAVKSALAHARRHFDPEMIVYVAGSDPYEGDPLGTLQVTRQGMLARDGMVARFARDLGCPLVVLPAGGYSSESPPIAAAGFQDIAEIEGS